MTLFAEEKKSDVRWGKFDPLCFIMALLDIDTALVWMYFSPFFSFEKEAGIHRKKKDMVARKTAPRATFSLEKASAARRKKKIWSTAAPEKKSAT